MVAIRGQLPGPSWNCIGDRADVVHAFRRAAADVCLDARNRASERWPQLASSRARWLGSALPGSTHSNDPRRAARKQ